MASSQCRPCEPRPTQGDVGDRELPHGCARRPCRTLREREVRLYADRLQLLSQPALPQMPGNGGKGMARRARGRAIAGAVLPRRVLAVGPNHIAYQNKAVIYDILFKASAETMITIAADPRHLGARI